MHWPHKFDLHRRLLSKTQRWWVGSTILCPLPKLIIVPFQNNNYYNPPAQKRQFRDPYGDWWDKQDRRNFGEPVHEDNDILTIFSTEKYTHFKPAKGFLLLGCAGGSVLLLSGVVSMFYPDKPSSPRTFEGGLERELGGPNAVRVSFGKPSRQTI